MKDEKIVSIEDRIPKLKKQRRKKANRRLAFYLSLFFLLISIIIYLQSPLSHIKRIEVLGNDFLSEEEIIKESELTFDTNIWKAKLQGLEALIKENPFIQSVKVTRKLPSTITIEVKEFPVVGYVEHDNSFQPLLENGQKAIYENRFMHGDAPLLIDFSDDKILDTISGQLSQLSQNILRLISEIHWIPEEENIYKVKLYMNDGFLVKGSIRNLAEKMEVYPSIISQLDPDQKGIIHINVGAYFEEFAEENGQ